MLISTAESIADAGWYCQTLWMAWAGLPKVDLPVFVRAEKSYSVAPLIRVRYF